MADFEICHYDLHATAHAEGFITPMLRRALLIATLLLLPAAAQDAPPARSFGHALLTNTRGLFSPENVAPGVIGVIATGSSALLDTRVQEYFGGERIAPVIGSIGTVLGNGLTIGGVSGILFYTSYRGSREHYKSFAFDFSQAFVLDSLLTIGVKAAVRRDRPDHSNSLAFYSGHTSGTTAAATVVAHYYPKYAIPAYLLAGLTGFSRIEKNRHWLSDVVAGHAVGFLIGSTVVRGHNPLKIGRLDWAPAIAPGGGLAIHASLNLDRRP